jgi:hypothetical protein
MAEDLSGVIADLYRQIADLQRNKVDKTTSVNFSASLVWSSSGVQPVLGNGAKEAQYRIVDGNLCLYQGALFFGTTTTPGTGSYSVNLPFPAHASGIANTNTPWFGAAKFWNNAGNEFPADIQIYGFTNVNFPMSSDGVAVPVAWASTYGATPNGGNMAWTILYRTT